MNVLFLFEIKHSGCYGRTEKKVSQGKTNKETNEISLPARHFANFLAFFDQGGCFQSRGFLILEIKTFGLESTIGDVLSEIHINIVQV